MAIDPYDRTWKRGVQLNWRTVEMLEITELRSLDRFGIVPLQLSQGSYNAGGVAASGGTHDGGGALDVRLSVLPTKYWNTVVYALRKTGFAAWLRNPSQGNWPYHIHAIAIGDQEMSPAAAQQVVWYKQGLNGLWGNAQGPDDGPQVEWTQYRQDIDLSYYGPENYDSKDWARQREVWLATEIGDVNLPDGRTVQPNVGQALRAAYWLRFRLAEGTAGADQLAKEMFSADGIFRNQSVTDETSPSARGPLTWFISDLEATQDKNSATLDGVATDVKAILGKLPTP